ncbi:uncharacterized protein LOC124919424 [Impatiens glandulifera]|uniref:uncharacterized protein LOC124919424 n=1 Tax=Impatiens glandulifera TaxID=253017 RepID=UPI001FB134C6|nr:uncharacterized protein LOC124919424 [Impatiens glandulifera]
MGSLVGGWDSRPLSDPRTVKLQKNKSMTKEQIGDYWRLKKKTEKSGPVEMLKAEEVVVLKRSASLPPESSENINKNLQGDQIQRKTGWWRRSNLAFLNEPTSSSNDYNSA